MDRSSPFRVVGAVVVAVTACAGVSSSMTGRAPAAPPATTQAPAVHPQAALPGEREFDFVIGEWRVRHRRLRKILQGSTEWYEFEGSLAARKFWNGRGHIDEFAGTTPFGRVDGMSIRLYEPASGQWRDYYTSASSRILGAPLVGRFEGPRIEFYGHELFEGRSIYVRQIWTSVTAQSCRWEQAFSGDGGKTWETNWIMDLTR